MKRLLTVILTVLITISVFSVSAAAVDESMDREASSVTYFADGSYCVTKILVEKRVATGTTITGRKTSDYYSTAGILQFTVTVKGTFTYNGATATATASNYGYAIRNSDWSFDSAYSFCSGPSATASCTFDPVLGFPRTLSVTLTCSPTGVLS